MAGMLDSRLMTTGREALTIERKEDDYNVQSRSHMTRERIASPRVLPAAICTALFDREVMALADRGGGAI